MRILNNSNPSSNLRSQVRGGSHNAKSRKHNLQQLENEVTKSRIAIQNMSHTRAIQSSLYKKVQELQKELHHCILSTNHEEQKQKKLEELNRILKCEMSQFQVAQRTEDELMCSSYEKKIKKVEYDIKQILHKYNQEIAKINWLKQQANSARDERVVYSNLFNKIEKQIKYYEQFYRQSLIKNQIFIDQKSSITLKNSRQHNEPLNDPIQQATTYVVIEFEHNDMRQTQCAASRKEVKIRTNNNSAAKSQKCPEHELFITTLKQTISKQQKEKTQKVISLASRDKGSQNWNGDLLIRQREAQIEAAIVLTQCRSLQQVFYTYSTLQKSNQNLTALISQIDQNISCLEEEIQRQLKKKRTSQVYQNQQFTDMVKIMKQRKSHRENTRNSESPAKKHLQQITLQICKLIGVQCSHLGDDVLREIDHRIDDLGFNIVLQRKGRRDSRLISAQQGSNSDRGVCQLLQKFDKFGESDKIFDRNMLRAEYQKQLSKAKKKAKKLA